MKRWLILGFLVAWVLLGPIGTAFDMCGAMMALCEIPCGAPSAMVDAVPTITRLVAVAFIIGASPAQPPAVELHALEPPPKPLRLSA
jgi:hypothetical protein